MTRFKIGPKFCTVALALGAAAAALAQAGQTLLINGKVASRDVRVIGGRPYVPLADVAKSMGQVVVKTTGGYTITAAGGANQVEGLRGKIGDTLFDGKWRFQVLSVTEADAYKMKTNMDTDYSAYHSTAEFDDASRVFRPKPGQTLLVIQCRVKNAVKQNQALYCYNAFTHTAVTDDREGSYQPIGYDMEGSRFQSKPLLPGSALDFAVLFTVPKGTKLKDLVFTLRTIGNEGSDARVSLAQ